MDPEGQKSKNYSNLNITSSPPQSEHCSAKRFRVLAPVRDTQ
jgi:hypothetical protein